MIDHLISMDIFKNKTYGEITLLVVLIVLGTCSFCFGIYCIVKANNATCHARTTTVSSQNITDLKNCVSHRLDSLTKLIIYKDSVYHNEYNEQNLTIDYIRNELSKSNNSLIQIIEILRDEKVDSVRASD